MSENNSSLENSKESKSSSNQHSGGTSIETGEEDEQDDSSSSQANSSVEDTLLNFRKEWQRELETTVDENKNVHCADDDDNENQAREWFLLGVEHEQKGKLYEAIQYYRRAVQLVPDIEFRLYDGGKVKDRVEPASYVDDSETAVDYHNESEGEYDAEDETMDFMTRLQHYMTRSRALCTPRYEQRATHMSALPMEIILYLLRWVVSVDLDLRSLEQFSRVCRGFYICSRDSEIWRLACLKVWGVNCGGLTNYYSWRDMFISRPRINYNGCYISKTTYTRLGENSFQDQFYRPWHLVEYFRYLRFYPSGVVLMLTTPDDPPRSVGLLKSRQIKNSSVLVGHYRLCDDKVIIVLKREDTTKVVTNIRYKNRRHREIVENTEQQFHIELEILPNRSKANCQLQWKRYSVITRKGINESCNQFEIVRNRFPPFWFSRVKSYSAESEAPLL